MMRKMIKSGNMNDMEYFFSIEAVTSSPLSLTSNAFIGLSTVLDSSPENGMLISAIFSTTPRTGIPMKSHPRRNIILCIRHISSLIKWVMAA